MLTIRWCNEKSHRLQQLREVKDQFVLHLHWAIADRVDEMASSPKKRGYS